MSAERQMRPVTRPRLYEQVAKQLADWMDSQQLKVGDRLPPEREIAAQLGVSRATVSQALVAMEVVGVVAVRHGDGAVVTSTVGMARITDAIRAYAQRLPDVLDARDALETKIAALAARRRTDTDMARIDDAVTAMADDIDAGGRGVEGDRQFHEAVTAAAHSNLLARMMGEISELILETRIESLGQEGRPVESLLQHKAVAEAIRAGEPEQAALAMHAHVSTISDIAILRDS